MDSLILNSVSVIFSGIALIYAIRANRMALKNHKHSIYDVYLRDILGEMKNIILDVYNSKNVKIRRDNLSKMISSARPKLPQNILIYTDEFQNNLLKYEILCEQFDSNGNKLNKPISSSQNGSFEDFRKVRGWLFKQKPSVMDKVFIGYIGKQ